MRHHLIVFLCLSFFIAFLQSLVAQTPEVNSEDEKIYKVIEDYIIGWRNADTKLLEQVFALKEGRVLWITNDSGKEELRSMTFGSVLEKRKKQPEYGLRWEILTSEVIAGKLACTKVFISRKGGSYIDLLVLQKLNGQWKIVTKTFVTRKAE